MRRLFKKQILIRVQSQGDARTILRQFSVRNHRFAVDENALDADWILVRIFKRRFIGDGFFVENYQIGGKSFFYQTSVF